MINTVLDSSQKKKMNFGLPDPENYEKLYKKLSIIATTGSIASTRGQV